MAPTPPNSLENQSEEDQDDLPKAERIQRAYEAWKKADGALTKRGAARMFGVAHTTLQGRIQGAISAEQRQQERQRLCPEEEAILTQWLAKLHA